MSNQPSVTLTPEMIGLLLRQTNMAVFQLAADATITAAEGNALRWLAGQTFVGHRLPDLAERPAEVEGLLAKAAQGERASQRVRIPNEHANYRIDATTGVLANADVLPAGDRWWNLTCQLFGDVMLVLVEDATELVEAQVARDEVLHGVRGILWHADTTLEEGELRWNLRIMNEEMGPSFLPLTLKPGQPWGQAWVQSRHPDDAERINRASTAALVGDEDRYRQVFRCYNAQGQIRYLSEDVQIQRLAPLHWRLVGLCTDVTELQNQSQRLREFEMLAQNALDAVVLVSPDRLIRYANPAAVLHLGYHEAAQLIGRPLIAIILPADLPLVSDVMLSQVAHGWSGELQLKCLDDRTWFTQASVFSLTDTNGAVLGSALMASDRSEQRQIERERQQFQEHLIELQRATLRELSTPLIPLANGVIAMPLVGTIDTVRAAQMMETLLEGIAQQQAESAIIDITGVKMVDTQVADVLLRVARAAQLLGARVILTGISAEVAQSMVQLGADLRGIVTLANLQAGIAYALEQANQAG